MKTSIVERDRGPQISGTRITVYDVLDYLEEGWHHSRIAAFFRLSSEQVLAAVDYIEAHKEQVAADYQKILQRSKERKNPPAIEAKRRQSRAKLQAELKRLHQMKGRRNKDASHHGR